VAETALLCGLLVVQDIGEGKERAQKGVNPLIILGAWITFEDIGMIVFFMV
jgi:hypothetical protein